MPESNLTDGAVTVTPPLTNGRWVTVTMIAKHAKKCRSSVLAALKAQGIRTEKVRGARGYRVQEKDANRFIARQWPEYPPLPRPGA
jgi:hypothetical protein